MKLKKQVRKIVAETIDRLADVDSLRTGANLLQTKLRDEVDEHRVRVIELSEAKAEITRLRDTIERNKKTKAAFEYELKQSLEVEREEKAELRRELEESKQQREDLPKENVATWLDVMVYPRGITWHNEGKEKRQVVVLKNGGICLNPNAAHNAIAVITIDSDRLKEINNQVIQQTA